MLKQRVALVIAADKFRDEEYKIPKELLEQAGMKVVTVSTTLAKVVGKLGMEVQPDILLTDLSLDKADALVFIGGSGTKQYFEDQQAWRLAQEFVAAGRVTGAICIAPVILAKAGVLKGLKATVFPDGAAELTKAGADYTGAIVEVDGKLITGNGPEAAESFGKRLVELLVN